jgi:hypothetical protein
MDDKDLAGIASQQMMMRLSDEPGQFRDPMAPFRDLLKAQRDALAGDSDDGSPMTWKF